MYKGLKYFSVGALASILPAITLNDTVIGIYTVKGTSMQPTLNSPLLNHSRLWKSDVVLMNLWAVRNYRIRRGEIVGFKSPQVPGEYAIKRVIGLEGDIVKKRDKTDVMVKVPEGHCWVEGDNPKNSLDSNNYGPVPLGLIFGKTERVIWPPWRWRKLEVDPPDRQRFARLRY